MVFKGAIFDMDGLLFDTERIYQQTWSEIAGRMGLRLDKGFVKAISGTNGKHMCQVIEKYYSVADGTAIMKECMELVKNKLSASVPVKEGVHEILNFFREHNIQIAVASSSPVQQIESNLSVAGIRNYFKSITSGTEVEHGKPAPDIFIRAAIKTGCQPEECCVFEDSENGIKAGHLAGCMTVMVPDIIEASPGILPYCSKICKDLKHAIEEIKKCYM